MGLQGWMLTAGSILPLKELRFGPIPSVHSAQYCNMGGLVSPGLRAPGVVHGADSLCPSPRLSQEAPW